MVATKRSASTLPQLAKMCKGAARPPEAEATYFT
jgi:hypothetical protein